MAKLRTQIVPCLVSIGHSSDWFWWAVKYQGFAFTWEVCPEHIRAYAATEQYVVDTMAETKTELYRSLGHVTGHIKLDKGPDMLTYLIWILTKTIY